MFRNDNFIWKFRFSSNWMFGKSIKFNYGFDSISTIILKVKLRIGEWLSTPYHFEIFPLWFHNWNLQFQMNYMFLNTTYAVLSGLVWQNWRLWTFVSCVGWLVWYHMICFWELITSSPFIPLGERGSCFVFL